MGSRLFLKLSLGVLTLSLISLLAGCGSDGTSELRIMHASPDTPDVNVILDGTTQTNPLPYGANTGYIAVKTGSRHVQLEPTTSTTNIVDQQVSVPKSGNVTLIMAGLSGNIQPMVLTDNNTAPTAGTAQVRLVNVAPGITSADVYVVPQGTSLVGATPTVAGLNFESASDYQPITLTAGTTTTYEVFFTEPGTTLAFLDSGPITLTSGQIRTYVLLNSLGGGFAFASLADLQ